MKEARDKEARINSFFARVAQIKRDFPVQSSLQKWDDVDQRLSLSIIDAQEKVHAAMCDNFDTPVVMETLELAVGAVNAYLLEQPLPKYPLVLRAASFVSSILSVFGVMDDAEGAGAGGGAGEGGGRDATVNAFVSVRDRIRQIAAASGNHELMQLSDSLRDESIVLISFCVYFSRCAYSDFCNFSFCGSRCAGDGRGQWHRHLELRITR